MGKREFKKQIEARIIKGKIVPDQCWKVIWTTQNYAKMY